MSDPEPSTPSSRPRDHVNLLLLDASDSDRDELHEVLSSVTTEAGAIHQASSAEGAWEIAEKLEHLEAFVAGVPAAAGDAIFDLKDRLVEKFGKFAIALCSESDMSAYYERVDPSDMLFFKPVDDEVMRRWLSDQTGMEIQPSLEPERESREEPEAADSLDEEEAPVDEKVATESGPGTASADPDSPLPDALLPLGTKLGDYELMSVIQSDEDLALYEAEQISIGRRVALKTLYRRHRRDPNWVGAFAHEARSRALISHPNISLVYEADQDRGVTYYTLELIKGRTLHQMAEDGEEISEETLWRLVKALADVLVYLKKGEVEHRLISSDSIFLVGESQPRVANPVKPGVPTSDDDGDQMRLFAAALRPFLKSGPRADRRLTALVDRMSNPARVDGIRTAEGLSDSIRRLEDQALEPEPAHLVEQRNNRGAIISGVTIGLLIIVGALLWYFLYGNRPEVKTFGNMVRIPDGSFKYQDGATETLPAFWIDEYEVSIGHYAEFLEALAADSSLAAKVAHPEQPGSKKSHRPPNWDRLYDAAIRGGKISGAPIDPNCPVNEVDWWDAYAYARWRGNRLPTEQEWEKAARGPDGRVFPWGNELDHARFNSGIDQDNGAKDGYRYWAPVDAHPSDESRYGVRGLTGNVTEWTDSWDSDPAIPDKQVPIKRGASFRTKDDFEVTARRPAKEPSERNLWTGFRTARSEPPLPAGSPPPPLEGPAIPEENKEGAATSAPSAEEGDTATTPSSEDGGTGGAEMTPSPDGTDTSAPPTPGAEAAMEESSDTPTPDGTPQTDEGADDS